MLSRGHIQRRSSVKDRGRAARIDDVILVGGSSQLTVFGDFLEEPFGRRPQVAARPDEIVALGAATYSHQGTFCTMYDNQRALRFEIYQGEGYFASENLKLGEVEVQVPPGPAGEQSALVTFTYDIDGILHVSAKSIGGDYRDRLILNPNLHLSEAERKRAMERIAEIKLAAQGSQKEQLLLERALRLYEQTTGMRREHVGGLITFWKMVMDEGDLINRQRNYARVQEELERMEAEFQSDPFAAEFWGDEEDWGDASEEYQDDGTEE